MPYMMDPGEDRIIADAMYAALTNPGHYRQSAGAARARRRRSAAAWAVTIQYLRGKGEQHFTLEQTGGDITGDHKGELYNGTLRGKVHGDQVELRSPWQVPGNAIHWTFNGTVQGNRMSGTVDMGEYGPATWTAIADMKTGW